MSAILDFYDVVYRPIFETYMNGFLDLEYPNFYLRHAFLSSVEAAIIAFLAKKVAIFALLLLRPSCKYFNVAPLP